MSARSATGVLALLAVLGLVAACGDDDTAATPETTTTEPAAERVPVTLADYAFEGLPASVPSGTTLEVTNTSTTELHELVAIHLPDAETRSIPALLALPQAELGALIGAAPPAAVLLSAPGGGPQIAAVGDGTLSEPGRYVVFCSIPVGADPQAYLDAAATSDGPPQVPGGPPHFTQGMAQELTVT